MVRRQKQKPRLSGVFLCERYLKLFDSFYKFFKYLWIFNGHLGKHFAVHGYFFVRHSFDQLAVFHSKFADGDI